MKIEIITKEISDFYSIEFRMPNGESLIVEDFLGIHTEFNGCTKHTIKNIKWKGDNDIDQLLLDLDQPNLLLAIINSPEVSVYITGNITNITSMTLIHDLVTVDLMGKKVIPI